MRSRDKQYYAILAEMGVGKTYIAIMTAAWLFSQGKINGMIVVAPKSICRNWAQKELPTHMPDNVPLQTVLWGPSSKGLDNQLRGLFEVSPLKLQVLVINIEALTTDRGYDMVEAFVRSHDTMFIVDESTTIKNPRAERTKIVIKLGLNAKYRRILTGTPVTQSPLDIYAQFDFLKHGCLGSWSYYGFRTQYAVLRKRYVNGRSFDEIVGYQRLEDLQKVIQPMSYRALKRDCLDLPEKIYTVRHVEPTKEQLQFYHDLKDEAMAMLSSGELVTAPLVITQLLRMRQALCNIMPVMATTDGGRHQQELRYISAKNPRADEVLRLLEEAGSQKVIIWATFIGSIKLLRDLIAEAYGAAAAGCIMGEVSADDRQAVVNAFQDESSPLRFIIAQPRTGGFGLTLTAATLVIYHDNDWSLEVRQQSEDRAHRIGQQSVVTYVDLVAPDTIDEKIRAALMEKKNLADLVTGDTLRALLST